MKPFIAESTDGVDEEEYEEYYEDNDRFGKCYDRPPIA